LHRELTLANLVLGENLEVTSETNKLAERDEPLGRIILIPLNGITIIHRELVVEVVISFTDGHQSSNNMVTRGMLIIKGRLAEPVSKGVNTESGLRINQTVFKTD
jgi:hypothetical protein